MSVYLPLQAREGVRIMDADTGISARSDVTTSSCPSPSLVAASRSRTAAVLALMGLAPVMLVIAVAIKLSDKGAALFTQVRVAKGGEPFRIYKFRTMAVDAEARLAEIRQDNEFDGVLFKIRRTRASPRSGRGCGSGRWTSCRSCSTCSAARCPWWAPGSRCRTRRRHMPPTSASACR